jgi:uncharacterized protein (DUF849 family)
LEPGAVARPHADENVPPLTPGELSSHLRALADAGAAEAILILRPIDEPSIRAVGGLLGST